MSLVNEMLRDLDKRRQSSPAVEAAHSIRAAAPWLLPLASTARWLPLALLALLLVIGAAGLWLYDHPQLWRGAGSALDSAPSGLPDPLTAAALSEPSVAPVQAEPQAQITPVQITQLEWSDQPAPRLVLTLNRAPPQRVLVSSSRTLQLDLGAVDLAVEFPDTRAALIRSAQFVNQNGHLTLELETYEDAVFRVVGRSGDQQHRLLLSIEPLTSIAAQAVPVTTEPASAEPAIAKPTIAASAAVAPVAVSRLKPETAKPVPVTSATPRPVQPPIPVAPLRKSAPQSLAQRDQAVVTQALAQLNRHQQSRAQQLLEAMLGQEPEASSSRTLLATLKMGAQQFDQAEQLIDTGLALDSGHAGLRKLKARLLIRSGTLSRAVALLSDDHPEIASDPEFHQIRAAALQAAGEHQQAAEAYHGLLQLRASEPGWWIGLALSLEALQQPQQAKKAYQNVFKIPQLSPVLAEFVSQRLVQLGG